jgi:hypothetical protein
MIKRRGREGRLEGDFRYYPKNVLTDGERSVRVCYMLDLLEGISKLRRAYDSDSNSFL